MFLITNSNVAWAACDDGTDVCLEQQSTDEVVEKSLANDVNPAGLDSRTAINDLVDSITADLKARRLTKPIGNNALQKVRRLQTIDPTHDYAINGVRYIARIYLSMARNDLKNNRIDRARVRLDAASATDSSVPGLQVVADKINSISEQSSATGTKANTAVNSSEDVSADSNEDSGHSQGSSESAVASSNSGTDTDSTSGLKAGLDATPLTKKQSAATAIDSSKLVAAGDEKSTAGDSPESVALITPVMVGLPAGTFVMGSESGATNEKPAHQVQVGAFSMSRYEITREQYRAFQADITSEGTRPALRQALLPVSGVTSNEAIAYTRWLSEKTGKRYRLPTEAEWEYAARAGSVTPYHSGDTVFGVANCLTCLDNIPRSATPVGSFEPNNFGLYDMHGNVAEWTSSCLTANHFKSDERAERLCPKRVVRGGSWRSTREQVRSSYRLGQPSSGRAMDTGIRVVHDGL